MGKKKHKARAEPMTEKRSLIWYGDWQNEGDLACAGYTSLAQNPEVATAVDVIASLIGSMTIHLMNSETNGDVRIENELSRIVDITPNKYQNRSNFIHWLVKTMLLTGGGNCVVYPETDRGYLRQLIPIPPAYVAFVPDGMWGYKVMINGREFDPDEVLHFAINPGDFYPWLGTGYNVSLADVAYNLKQSMETEKGFMQSKWKPSLIVRVDGMNKDFANPAGRKKLTDEYLTTNEAGQPWIVPANLISVEQVKPLTLSDLALAEFVKIDKETVASILGVPPFVLGVGEFKRDAWNNFINSKIMPVAKIIEQELTRKLIYGERWFFRFNARSLYNYDLKDLANIADDQFTHGIMTGNEVRDWLGLSPRDDLDELIVLENYIPIGRIGDQKKLNGGGENDG